MVSLGAWLLFPVVAWLASAGVGLLAGRIVRAPATPGLAAPVGCCVAVVAVLPVYKLGGTVWLGAPLLAALAVAGWALARGTRREHLLPGWPGVAALAAYALFIAPVVLSGHWTWLGYNFVNDTAVNLVMTQHVAEEGIRLLDGPASTTSAIVNGTLGSRYPMGLQTLLASLHGLVAFLPLEAVYQPFIALLAGLAAMAFAALALRLGAPGPLAAGLGAVAVGANLTYQYAAHGAFKEVALVLVLAAAAALCRMALDDRLRLGAVALLGAVLAAGLVIFSTAAGAYAGMFALLLLAAAVLAPWRPPPVVLARAAAVGVAVLVLAALPGLGDALAFGRSAGDYYAGGPASVAFLGHLLRPLPLHQAIGVWPGGDYRLPLEGTKAAATAGFTVLVVALLVVAALVEGRRRRLGALLALVPCLAVYLVGASRLAPYAEAKLLVLLAPAVVFAAGMGAVYAGRRLPVLGAVTGALLAGGVLFSDALAFHDVRVAPVERLEALRDAAAQTPEQGMVLLPEWEEWAKYFAGERQNNVAPESFSPRSVALREYFPFFARSIDLDQMQLTYVQEFPTLLLRRSPSASRPPANYQQVYRNRFYEVWRRRPGMAILEHMPLQDGFDGAARPDCAAVRELAARTPPGTTLVGAPRQSLARFDYTQRPPAGWVPNDATGLVTPLQPGDPAGSVRLAGGRYRIWLRGSTGRAIQVRVDGRRVGDAQGVNTPDQWLQVTELGLEPGAHRVSLLRPGGRLAPGDGFSGQLGALAFEPVGRPALVQAAPEDAERTFCARSWDWIEQVRGG